MGEGPLEIRIRLDEIRDFARLMQAAPEVAAQELHATTETALGVLEGAIAGETPVGASGHLRGSWTHELTGTPFDLHGEVFTPLAYGLPVETGRRPGKPPPVEAIQIWVTRKLGLAGDEAAQAAYLIARAIGWRGTKGVFMAQRGFDLATPGIWSHFETLPDRLFDRLLGRGPG